jgi:hypothetical protein
MTDCPKLPKCPFFSNKLQNMPAVAEMTKASYCRGGHYESCARFIVSRALGSEAVADNLFPDQQDRVAELLNRSKR